jgi:hypothetical protein
MGDLGILFCRPGPGSTLEDAFDLEADVADDLGLATHIVVADLVVEREAELACEALPDDAGPLLYRGPILTADAYAELYEAAADRGAYLVVEPAAYEHALYVPEHHDRIADLSPPTAWTESEDIDEALVAARTLGPPPYLLKDHVKSAKEDWEGACYVPPGADANAFREVAEGLLAYRGDRFERGFVIRKFLDLRTSGVRTPERRLPEEHRLFFFEGDLVAHAPYHPLHEPLTDVAPYRVLGDRIDSPFFTADIAFPREGGWIVVEINDGGISVLPESLDPRALYAAFTG